jgi:hypothetical protein
VDISGTSSTSGQWRLHDLLSAFREKNPIKNASLSIGGTDFFQFPFFSSSLFAAYLLLHAL